MNTAIMTTATSIALLLSVGFLNHGPSAESAKIWFSHRPVHAVGLFEVSRFRWTGLFAECREDMARQPGSPDCAFVEAACGVGVASGHFAPIVWISRALTLVCAELVVEPER